MFKDLLNSAKSNFEAHQRAEEIRHLDIDPEEYVMLRDDKSPMGVDLLRAILEKLNLPNWEVDEGTTRIVRISETPGYRKAWSLALTSDTRRFHLKIYRDFESDLQGVDLIASRGICSAIKFVEATIQDLYEQRIREAELRRLALLEEEERRIQEEELYRLELLEEEKRRKEEELTKILAKVEHINKILHSIHSKELKSFKLGEEIIQKSVKYIADKVDTLPQAEISVAVANLQETQEKFTDEQFKIIDNIPCTLNESADSIKISNKFIKHCINAKNHILPKYREIQFNEATKEFVFKSKESDESLISSQGADNESYVTRTPISTLNSTRESSIPLSKTIQVHVQKKVHKIQATVDPLQEITNLLMRYEQKDQSTRDDMAKITVLNIYLETSTFDDLMVPINEMLSSIAHNVSLLAWNSINSVKKP